MLNDTTTGTPSDNVGDLASLTIADQSGSTSNSPAFIRYRVTENSDGSTGPTIVEVVFRKAGTAVLTANLTGKSVSRSFTNTVLPELTGIVVSPQNLQLQGIPNSSASYQYYCTGYLATGEAVDLTRKVNWALETPSGGSEPTTILGGTNGGLLLFGSRDSLSPLMSLRANYVAGPDDTLYSDYGQSYFDDSNLSVPVSPSN
jgi:hypothetical protein